MHMRRRNCVKVTHGILIVIWCGTTLHSMIHIQPILHATQEFVPKLIINNLSDTDYQIDATFRYLTRTSSIFLFGPPGAQSYESTTDITIDPVMIFAKTIQVIEPQLVTRNGINWPPCAILCVRKLNGYKIAPHETSWIIHEGQLILNQDNIN